MVIKGVDFVNHTYQDNQFEICPTKDLFILAHIKSAQNVPWSQEAQKSAKYP